MTWYLGNVWSVHTSKEVSGKWDWKVKWGSESARVSAEKRRNNQTRVTKENVTEKLSAGVCAKLKEPQGKAKLPWDQPQLEFVMTPGPNGPLKGRATRIQNCSCRKEPSPCGLRVEGWSHWQTLEEEAQGGNPVTSSSTLQSPVRSEGTEHKPPERVHTTQPPGVESSATYEGQGTAQGQIIKDVCALPSSLDFVL